MISDVERNIRVELAWGAYVAFVCNLAMVAVLNNPLAASTRTWFVVMGAGNELLGVLMIASPELIPLARSAPGALARSVRRLIRWTRLRFKKTHRVGNSASMGFDVGIVGEAASVTRKPDDAWGADERIDWLVGELQRQGDEVERLKGTVADHPARWKREIDQSAKGLADLSQSLVANLADRNLALRLLGLLFVVLGLCLSTVGNLV